MSNSTFHDSNRLIGGSGKRYTKEIKPFSSGGEGDIYGLVGVKDKVVKLYHPDKIDKELEYKLVIMVKRPPVSSVLSQVAWPLDVVYDSSGNFRGFVMPRLSITAELNEIYAYPPRTNITFKEKLILAQNICVVISEVHKSGYVFGDFNPHNIGINTKTGAVAFLDTDSYHIKDGNMTYRCKVCLDGYVAPELLKKCEAYKNDAYANAPLPTFTKETDNFALAIHIFKLLMNGFTPYNGIKFSERVSTASPGVGNQAVKRDAYCFKPGNKPMSPAVPPADILPDRIKKLFKRAFIDGKKDPAQRPDAREWYSALAEYESKLKVCSKNKTHMYYKRLSKCPWCAADEKYRQSLNPSPAAVAAVKAPVSVTPVTVPAASYNASKPPAYSPAAATVSNSSVSLRGKIVKSSSFLYPLSWIVLLASIVYGIYPFIKDGSLNLADSVLMGINYPLLCFISIFAIAFMSFAAALWNASLIGPVTGGIWGVLSNAVVVTAKYVNQGYGAASSTEMWKFFGVLLFVCAALLIAGWRVGTIVRTGAKRVSKKISFSYADCCVLGVSIFLDAFGIWLLFNLPKYYYWINNNIVFAIAVWVVPVVYYFLRFISDNEIVEKWIWPTLAVMFDLIVLYPGKFTSSEGRIGAVILLLVLAIIALWIMAENEIWDDGGVNLICFLSAFVIFVAGCLLALKVATGDGISETLQLWVVAPAIADVGAAVISSVYSCLFK